MRSFGRAILASLLIVGAALGVRADNLKSSGSGNVDWPSYGGSRDEIHYSPLSQINDRNVDRLGLAWYADLGPTNSFSAPIEVDGVLYFATGYSVLHAMDARTGKPLWAYDPEVWKYARDKARMGLPIRGIAYDKGKIFTGTLDGRLIAVDARSGALLWSVMTLDPEDESVITGPPWVFNGKVVIGQGGADYGPFRGFVTAYDQNTGKLVWRFHTVPGNPALGFENKAMEMAAKTWKGEWWKWGGGGTAWHAMAYDPKFNRLYIGTGNGFPWNQKIRSPGGGDNLFLCSIVALDADTGAYVWHYQVNPGESWDYNSAMDIELADLKIDGKLHPVLLHAPKNGFFYVIDRTDGKLISAEKFTKVNWADRIDLATGRPVENPDARYPDGKVFPLFPASQGAHSVAAMSFNPGTGLVYLPAAEHGRYYADPPNLAAWHYLPRGPLNSGIAGAPPGTPPLPKRKSMLLAWDPVLQKARWSLTLPNTENGGTLTTAGNLVVQGESNGEIWVMAANTGKRLWTFDAQVGVLANPITYMLDGKQYLTVIAGFRGYVGNEPDWEYRLQKRRVLTFVLDGKASLPKAEFADLPFADDPAFKIDPQKAEFGRRVYATRCVYCHGQNVGGGGSAPDLRKSQVALSADGIASVARDGALVPAGMPQFEELSQQELDGLEHFIRMRARESIAAQNAAPAHH
jgi:quinohemoprotein ethanol dehydrogenase